MSKSTHLRIRCTPAEKAAWAQAAAGQNLSLSEWVRSQCNTPCCCFGSGCGRKPLPSALGEQADVPTPEPPPATTLSDTPLIDPPSTTPL